MPAGTQQRLDQSKAFFGLIEMTILSWTIKVFGAQQEASGNVNTEPDSSIARPSAQGSSGHVNVESSSKSIVIRTALGWLPFCVQAQAMAGREMVAASASREQQQHSSARVKGDVAHQQLSLLQAKQACAAA